VAVSKGLISERTENARQGKAYSSSACREVRSALIVAVNRSSHAQKTRSLDTVASADRCEVG